MLGTSRRLHVRTCCNSAQWLVHRLRVVKFRSIFCLKTTKPYFFLVVSFLISLLCESSLVKPLRCIRTQCIFLFPYFFHILLRFRGALRFILFFVLFFFVCFDLVLLLPGICFLSPLVSNYLGVCSSVRSSCAGHALVSCSLSLVFVLCPARSQPSGFSHSGVFHTHPLSLTPS